MNDEFMIKRLCRDDEGALKYIYDHYYSYVYAVANSRIGAKMQKEDIEEVVSDVFLTLWNNRRKLNANDGTIKAYLGVMTRNQSINKLREFHFCDKLMDSNILSTELGIEEAFIQKETLLEIYEIVTKMKSPDKEIFFSYYMEEQKTREIADLLMLNENTVKTKLRRNKKKSGIRFRLLSIHKNISTTFTKYEWHAASFSLHLLSPLVCLLPPSFLSLTD